MLKIVKRLVLLLIMAVFMNAGFTQIITKSDLYGVWAYSAKNEEAELLNLTALKPSNEGLDILIAKDDKDSFKVRQNFTWDFNEETQMFSQVAHKITYFVNGKEESSENPKESSTSKIELLKLGEEVIGIKFIVEGEDDQTFLKVDMESLQEKIGNLE
ncbi:hypothetical protein [Wohlfahrtiimonas larvae]|uniref:Lipocalin-like domain-containing protein n=1 Tax=Wohlfahrtiimonas larvae TaxID=1157986 RepID=A0ABP9MTU6_9GAMM|nr:hypothetical protein [Wohlfahrtiimonas larvae]